MCRSSADVGVWCWGCWRGSGCGFGSKKHRRSRPICRPGTGGPAGGLAEGGAIMRCAPPFVAPASGPGLPRFFEAREARATESAPAASPLTRTGQGFQSQSRPLQETHHLSLSCNRNPPVSGAYGVKGVSAQGSGTSVKSKVRAEVGGQMSEVEIGIGIEGSFRNSRAETPSAQRGNDV